MDKRIGLIGLGIMGKPMARNLLKAGYPLTVYSRGRSAVEALLADGAAGARSSQEVAERSDVVITMVTDTPDVRQVILGEHSVLTGMQVGGIIIDMSTISPSVTREIAEVVKAKGVHFLDAPVSGGEGGAMGRSSDESGDERGPGVRRQGRSGLGENAPGDQRRRGRLLATLEPGAAHLSARFRARLHGQIAAEGPAIGLAGS